jgi:hypothetical protein
MADTMVRMRGTRSGLKPAHFVFLPAVLLALSSCSRGEIVLVAIDEAFGAARPGLSEAFSGPWPGGPGPLRLFLGLNEAPGRVLSEIERAAAAGKRPKAVIASPYIAAGLCDETGPIRSLGSTGLVALEWPRPPLPGLSYAKTDPRPAYAAAGRAAGAFIAALGEAGGKLGCGVVYLESPSRPQEALDAFSSSFVEASRGAPLLVRRIEGQDGKREEADLNAEANSAVKEILSSDVRVIFVAAGSASPAALVAASRPGIAVGADLPGRALLPGLSFRIRPDDEALAAAALRIARDSGSGRALHLEVPSILEAGPSSAAFKAGGEELGAFIAQARDKKGR